MKTTRPQMETGLGALLRHDTAARFESRSTSTADPRAGAATDLLSASIANAPEDGSAPADGAVTDASRRFAGELARALTSATEGPERRPDDSPPFAETPSRDDAAPTDATTARPRVPKAVAIKTSGAAATAARPLAATATATTTTTTSELGAIHDEWHGQRAGDIQKGRAQEGGQEDVQEGVHARVQAGLAADVHPDVDTDVHPSLAAGVHPGVAADVHPSVAADVHPGVAAGVLHPSVAADVHRGVAADVHHPGVAADHHPGVAADVHHPGIPAGVHASVAADVLHRGVAADVHPSVAADVAVAVPHDVRSGLHGAHGPHSHASSVAPDHGVARRVQPSVVDRGARPILSSQAPAAMDHGAVAHGSQARVESAIVVSTLPSGRLSAPLVRAAGRQGAYAAFAAARSLAVTPIQAQVAPTPVGIAAARPREIAAAPAPAVRMVRGPAHVLTAPAPRVATAPGTRAPATARPRAVFAPGVHAVSAGSIRVASHAAVDAPAPAGVALAPRAESRDPAAPATPVATSESPAVAVAITPLPRSSPPTPRPMHHAVARFQREAANAAPQTGVASAAQLSSKSTSTAASSPAVAATAPLTLATAASANVPPGAASAPASRYQKAPALPAERRVSSVSSVSSDQAVPANDATSSEAIGASPRGDASPPAVAFAAAGAPGTPPPPSSLPSLPSPPSRSPSSSRSPLLASSRSSLSPPVSERQANSPVASSDQRTDPGAQARPSEKAPPAPGLEVVEKGIGSPGVADKGQSFAAKPIHTPGLSTATAASTSSGTPLAAAGAGHRPASLDAATLSPSVSAAAGRGHGAAGHHPAPADGLQSPARVALPWSPRHAEASGAAKVKESSSGEPSLAAGVAAPLHAVAAALAPAHPAAAPVFDGAAPPLPAPPPLPAAPASLLAYAADDLSLRATVMPERAVLSVDTGAGGELALHLRIKDGVTDVHVSGEAAASLDVRVQDLRAALASEGLTLGSFESGQSPPRQADVEARDEAPAPRLPASATPNDGSNGAETSVLRGVSRGVHITA